MSTTPFLNPEEEDGREKMYDSDSEPESNHPPIPSRKTRKDSQRWRRPLHLILQLTIYSLAIFGFTSILPFLLHDTSVKKNPDVYRPSTLPAKLNHCSCGSNVTTALSLYCVYSPLAAAWLPPHCHDAHLTAQFNKAGPGVNGSWEYFGDINGTMPLTIDQVGQRQTFYASMLWHRVHCLFYWRKYWRMRKTDTVMEERFDSWDHLLHCQKLIMRSVPEGGGLVEVPVRFSSEEGSGSEEGK